MPATDNLQWATFSDFTPGIHSQVARSSSGVAGPFPLGAAQQTGTFRCFALPNGGLAPLPKRVHAWSPPSQSAVVIGPKIVAFEAMALNQNTTGFPDELHFGIQWYTTGISHFRWYRQRIFVDDGFDTLKSIDAAIANTAFACYNFATSRMHPTDPTQPGIPIMALAWFGNGGAFTSVFPPPAAPATTAVLDLDVLRLLKVLSHQNRLVVFEDISYSHGAIGVLEIDEQISFTDPANSVTLGSQNEVFVSEQPYGFGGYGSISSGELFIIKRKGGGFIISGDIADPSITRLPGVVSTGRWSCKATSSPNGLFYGGADGGCYVWRGADTSTKVSNQLSDNFLVEAGHINSLGSQIQMADWLEWVVCSNTWLYDTVTDSWWRLDDPSEVSLWGFSRSFDARYMYGCRSEYVNGGEAAFAYDRNTPANDFSWQSHPLSVSANTAIDVREIVVRAQGTGTVTITATPYADEPAPIAEVYTVSSPSVPQMIRHQFRAQGENITIKIESDSGNTTTPAPVVYEVRVGYIGEMHGPD